MKEWSYFDKFETINDRYLPSQGEGETKATQVVTAVTKLVYKWYNDGDVYDNTYALEGWCNDLSSYANWLHSHSDDKVKRILEKIAICCNGSDYEDLLAELADTLLDSEELEKMNAIPKDGSIYKCEGHFVFEEYDEEEEDDDYWY